SRQLIMGNVVDLELARVDVPQYQVGRTRPVSRRDARELPIQTDGADEGGAGELVVVDVIDFQPAGIDVAQQEIGFAGDAAEIADARELPLHADIADERSAGELVVGDVINLQSAGI